MPSATSDPGLPTPPKRPRHLYHYTDGSALLQILESGSLRASEAVYLNDSQEIKVGAKQLREKLRDKITDLEGLMELGPETSDQMSRSDLSSRIAVLRSGLSRHLEPENPLNQMNLRPFITCFSAARDSLSQWRAYGNYSLTFQTEKLQASEVVGRSPTPAGSVYTRFARSELALIESIYSDTDFAPVVKAAIDDVAGPGRTLGGRGMPFLRFDQALLELLTQRKDDGFSEEKEWRLCYVRQESQDDLEPKVEYRSGALTIVPYINLKFDSTAITEILVGPGSHQELQISALRRLVKRRGIKVDRSSIPYRTSRGQSG